MWRSAVAAIGSLVVLGAAATWVASPPTPPGGWGDGARRGDAGPTAVSATAALESFDACGELTGWLARHAEPHVGPWGLEGGPGALPVLLDGGMEAGSDAVAAAAPSAPALSGARAAGGQPAFSGTNVQEAGVDEPDTVKTDGTRLFTVRAGRLLHVDLTGDAPRVAGSVAVGDGHDGLEQADLLLAGDRLLVTWTSWDHPGHRGGVDDAALSTDVLRAGGTRASLFDVSGDTPRLLESARLDGRLVSGRLHGDTARLVLRNQPQLPLVAPRTDEPHDLEAARRANLTAIRDATAAQWLPWLAVTDHTGARPVTSERPMVRCEDVHHASGFAGMGTLDVLTVPLDGSLEDAHATSVLTGAETVYASTERLYVTTYAWPQPGPPASGQPGILPGRPALVGEPGEFRTGVHAFDLTDEARTAYVGSGEVPGHVLNQFSLSEHDGHLRVATTEGAPWDGGSVSGVHVLRLDDGGLTEVGSVGDLGRGERIYAVRYVGDTGYVVTFRQVDPLYTLDLSDPTAPTVLGELKIPGYSAYLHPVGDRLLLGIGQDATDQGRVLGTQVALFDVRDLRAPVQVAKTVIQDGSSEAEVDHHAFLHWAPTGLTVVPVSTWSGPIPWTGAMAFRVEGERLTRVGEVSHVGAVAGPGRDPGRDPGHVAQVAGISRSLVVGDALLTLSAEGLLTSDLDTLLERHWLPLR